MLIHIFVALITDNINLFECFQGLKICYNIP